MNPKTKLIVGIACCASLAIGIAQPLWLPKSLSSSGAVISFDDQTNDSKGSILTNPIPSSWILSTNGGFEPVTRTNWNGQLMSIQNGGVDFFRVEVTQSTSNSISAFTWSGPSNFPPIHLAISTNNSVNWVTIEHDPQAAVISAKQVGTVQTNRILTVIHDGATNLVLLKILGKEEWPSQTRVVQGRRQ